MSTIHPFSHDQPIEDNKNLQNEPQYVRPEFTILDDQNDHSQTREEKPKESAKKGDPSPTNSFSLKILCLLGVVFCLIYGIGMLLISVIMSVVAALTLFQNHEINRSARKFWKISLNTLVAGFGLGVSILNPALGFGLLFIYFSISEGAIGTELFRTIFKRSF